MENIRKLNYHALQQAYPLNENTHDNHALLLTTFNKGKTVENWLV